MAQPRGVVWSAAGRQMVDTSWAQLLRLGGAAGGYVGYGVCGGYGSPGLELPVSWEAYCKVVNQNSEQPDLLSTSCHGSQV